MAGILASTRRKFQTQKEVKTGEERTLLLSQVDLGFNIFSTT
jgi:hypothetical protein